MGPAGCDARIRTEVHPKSNRSTGHSQPERGKSSMWQAMWKDSREWLSNCRIGNGHQVIGKDQKITQRKHAKSAEAWAIRKVGSGTPGCCSAGYATQQE